MLLVDLPWIRSDVCSDGTARPKTIAYSGMQLQRALRNARFSRMVVGDGGHEPLCEAPCEGPPWTERECTPFPPALSLTHACALIADSRTGFNRARQGGCQYWFCVVCMARPEAAGECAAFGCGRAPSTPRPAPPCAVLHRCRTCTTG